MLIVLPASEAKVADHSGPPVDLDSLSFPTLGPARRAVLAATGLGAALEASPTGPAGEVYDGVLQKGFAYAGLPAPARRRAERQVVVVSPLWGAVRLEDRIPGYRLDMCARPPGLGHLPQAWQPALSEALDPLARFGVVVDFRRAEYATAWKPERAVVGQVLTVKVVRAAEPAPGAGAHNSKRTRGLVARQLVVAGDDPASPEDVADALAPYFAVALGPPPRPGRMWELRVVEAAAG